MLTSGKMVGFAITQDYDAARAFYEGNLGFQVKEERSDGVTYQDAAGGWFLVYPSQFAGTAKSTYMSFEVADVPE